MGLQTPLPVRRRHCSDWSGLGLCAVRMSQKQHGGRSFAIIAVITGPLSQLKHSHRGGSTPEASAQMGTLKLCAIAVLCVVACCTTQTQATLRDSLLSIEFGSVKDEHFMGSTYDSMTHDTARMRLDMSAAPNRWVLSTILCTFPVKRD